MRKLKGAFLFISGVITGLMVCRVWLSKHVKKTISNEIKTESLEFGSLEEANKILSALKNIIDIWGYASVADAHDISGSDSSYTDSLYGWTNLKNVRITCNGKDNYVLELPRPMKVH